METAIDDSSKHRRALAYLRHREYSHLQHLIQTNSVEHFVEPLTTIKTMKNEQSTSYPLDTIFQSMNTFRRSHSSNHRTEEQMAFEKCRSKLAMLIF
jgi:hypothetical protein